MPLSSALPTSMNVAASSANGTVGFSNPGYWGIDVQPQTYTGSFWVYGAYSGQFTASLYSDTDDTNFATAQIASQSVAGKWTQHNFTLSPDTAASNTNNSFSITFDGSAVNGSLNFNLISLFPPTYNDRPNGLRRDLMTSLKGLNPSFLRFPGGNNLEGNDPPYLWRWNETIGPLTNRPGRPGTWGYQNTDGLGLVEYLYWCQDLGMEPILAVWAGEYLDGTILSEDELAPYVQDALNELEFIMGDTSTQYGALRESLGYGSDPIMQINYVEVGNEDNLNGGEDSYNSYRFPMFYNALKNAYPDLNVIASTVDVDLPGDALGDYHEYTRPDYFVGQFNFFDQNTAAHKTLIGEYATVQPNVPQGGGVNWNDPRSPYPFWIGTVGEAVFLLGAERNAAAILGASYAPTLQDISNPDAYQWIPDMISYTAAESSDVLSTSYHMVQLMSSTRIGTTLPVTSDTGFGPVYYVAGSKGSNSTSPSTKRSPFTPRGGPLPRQATGSSGGYILKAAVYNSTSDVSMSVSFPGVSAGSTATLTVLTAPDAESYSTLGNDVVQKSVTSVAAAGNGTFVFNAPDLSVLVLETD
ncbi:MAG: hypothetical protein Q9227_000678 [Pyrenula ochraceoflavens]